MKERVQKLMAQADIGSRRACEEIIREGRVRVNGTVITLGDQADPETDVIEVDGVKISPTSQTKIYFVVNKPVNMLSTNEATPGDDRPTVREQIPYDGHLFTIGRLDAESEGLMVLTNDGDLANRLTHPRYEHTKTYKVVVYGMPTEETLAKWESGVWLPEGKTARCFVKVMQSDKATTTLRIVMTEGRKRQIRRVATLLGHPVKKLTRTHIGKLGLGTLRRGEWYQLDKEEVEALRTPADELKIIRKQRQAARRQKQAARRGGSPSGDSSRRDSPGGRTSRKDAKRRDNRKRK